MPDLSPGTSIHLDHRKWDGGRHWQNGDGRYLGEDRFGRWVGVPVGARVHRPGHEFFTDSESVAVFAQQPWTARFYDRPAGLDADLDRVQVYVDVCSIPA